jgi:ABC-type multidrug transport system permease subunit
MKRLNHVYVIAEKELKLFFADRSALFFFILFPFFFVILFQFLMRDVGSEDRRLEINLATKEDNGGISHRIIEAMETKEDAVLRPGEPRITWQRDHEKAYRAVRNGGIDGFLLFAEDFTEGLMMGYGAGLRVVSHARAPRTRAALTGIAQSIASQIGSRQVASKAVVGLLVGDGSPAGGRFESEGMATISQIVMEMYAGRDLHSGKDAFITFETRKTGEVEAENPSNFVIPGYLVMFVFFAAALAAERIVQERQNNTLERILASSVRRESIIGGIYLGIAARGLIQIIIFWTVGLLVFHMDLGLSPAAVIILSLLTVLMSSSFALMLATLARTQRSAGSAAVLTSLVLAPLGGCWWPLFITPRWMQMAARIAPHSWATTGFNKLLVFGADFQAIVPEICALLAFTLVFGIVALVRFRTSGLS